MLGQPLQDFRELVGVHLSSDPEILQCLASELEGADPLGPGSVDRP